MNNDLETRWHEGTKELLNKLEEKGVDRSSLNTLEMFGRDGTWHTLVYANKVKSLEVWENDSKWLNDLKKNLPNAVIKITDSITQLSQGESFLKFNFIIIDNPMNTFGPKSQDGDEKYCEHFDVIRNIDKIIDEQAIVVFNVNKMPFDYDKFPLWKKRRDEFYGNINTSNMKLEFLTNFYEKLFEKLGFETLFHVNVVRVFYKNKPMTYYFAYHLKRL